jgi:Flp pilus assembly protein TadD
MTSGAVTPPAPKSADADAVRAAFDLFNHGQTEAAEAACRELLPARPQDAQLLFLLGMVLHKSGRDTEAVKHLSQAAQLQPSAERIFQGLGCAHLKLKNNVQAIGAFERALSLNPQSNPTWYNLGNALFPLDHVARAADAFQKAVAINPEDHGSWNNLGKCLKELNRLEESLAAYDCALRLKPDYALARYGRAVTLLTLGRYAEGFKEYEWREQLRNTREFNAPLWNGELIPGKTLFIHAEQGFGDAIQTARFIAQVRERVGTVILECRPELKTLFQRCVPADTIIAFGETIPAFDYFIPMSSLPRALGIKNTDDVPSAPYLRASTPEHKNPSSPLKVGLAWAGNPHHHHDACRSLRLQDLAPILNVPGVSFYSLQQPVPERDAVYLRSISDIVCSHRPFRSFLDTADFIAGLDLVITVDTAIAHLAGAMGKPVWLLLQHSPDWRWQMDRTDSPWYPNTQLFRQTERGYWHPPVQRATEALQQQALARLGLTQIIPLVECQTPDRAPVLA